VCICDGGWLGDYCEQACMFYVDDDALGDASGTSWDNAFTTIEQAIDATWNPPCEIWVAEGVYYPGDYWAGTVDMPQATEIYGGFVGNESDTDAAALENRDWKGHPSVLDGLGVVDHVVTASFLGEGSTTVSRIDGFFIAGGNASGSIGSYVNVGGGMLVSLSTELAVENCLFIDNRAAVAGGALAVMDDAVVTINKTIFSNNAALTLTGGGKGGAIMVQGGTDGYASVSAFDTIFTGNVAGTEGGAFVKGSNAEARLENSTFVGNVTSKLSIAETEFGGAISISTSGGAVTIGNSTIYGNSSLHGGGFFQSSDVETRIMNSIFSTNTPNELSVQTNSNSVRLLCSDIYGDIECDDTDSDSDCDMITYDGTIQDDPLFKDTGLTGTWGSIQFLPNAYQTVLIDNTAPFPEPLEGSLGDLAGLYLKPKATSSRIFLIARNTANAIYVWGDLESAEISSDDVYKVIDLQLKVDILEFSSPCIDTANCSGATLADIEGTIRCDFKDLGIVGVTADMGAYEVPCD
jgi:hypothetical protein